MPRGAFSDQWQKKELVNNDAMLYISFYWYLNSPAGLVNIPTDEFSDVA